MTPLHEALSRRITLTARRGMLGDRPAEMAGRLRSLMSELVVEPMVRETPWLSDTLALP